MPKGLQGFQKGNKIGLGKKYGPETRKKMSVSMCGNKNSLGTKRTPESRRKMSLAQMGNKKGLGHKKSEEYKRCWSEKRKGANGSNWKGGLTPALRLARASVETNIWRIGIFIRDKQTCQRCFKKTKDINAHHIQNFSQYPKLRYVLSNGITLCKKCHTEFHKKFGKQNNNQEQLNTFFI